MKQPKRLFLFAGYDKQCVIDDALVYYVSNLARFGDVVLYMDCNAKKSEINKIKKYCLYVNATRHAEYDFGSYKRAYIWARDNDILKNYDVVYLINDSVFGPLQNIRKTLDDLESIKSDAAGLVVSKHRTHSYMESWFVRLNRTVFLSKWFDNFMSGITQESSKTDITIKYEHGLSNLIKQNGCSWDGVYKIKGRYTYNHPKALFLRGCPFIKKMSFTRHNGAIGNQIKYILAHANTNAVRAIKKSASRVYGDKYMKWLLTYSPFKIILRNIIYATSKITGNKK